MSVPGLNPQNLSHLPSSNAGRKKLQKSKQDYGIFKMDEDNESATSSQPDAEEVSSNYDEADTHESQTIETRDRSQSDPITIFHNSVDWYPHRQASTLPKSDISQAFSTSTDALTKRPKPLLQQKV
ncbi:MAG: hypothetical protein V4591_11720, partial [Bdellovibrionota bacterium]